MQDELTQRSSTPGLDRPGEFNDELRMGMTGIVAFLHDAGFPDAAARAVVRSLLARPEERGYRAGGIRALASKA